jgi:hypothetical protein
MLEIRISRNCFSIGKPMDQVHEFVDRVRVAGPRFHRGLHSGRRPRLVRARPSGRSGPRWLAARVATGRVRRGASGEPLTGARAMTRRRRTGDKTSALIGHGASTIEEGRRRGEGGGAPPECGYPFIGSIGRRGSRKWRVAAVIGAFMATITGVKGAG